MRMLGATEDAPATHDIGDEVVPLRCMLHASIREVQAMRIAFMGSGGLGGYFGARLCNGGAEVHFIARGKHLQAMREEGLRVEGPEPIHIPRVRATDDPGEVGVVDFVMVCVKLWDTEAALKQLRAMSGVRTTVISFQSVLISST